MSAPPSPPSPPPNRARAATDGIVEAMRALAAGHLTRAGRVADDLEATRPLVAAIVRADAAARMAEIGCAQLRDLDARLAADAPDQPLLRWWVVAVLGERALLDADLAAVPLAVQTLTEMPSEPFAPTPVMYVRGRLRRIAAAAYLSAPSAGAVAGHDEWRDAAVADFLRCDFAAEAAITRGLAAALRAIATWDDVVENQATVEDIRATLGDQEGSIWVPLLDQLAVLVAVTAGDVTGAADACAQLDAHRGDHRVFSALAAFSHAVVHLLRTDAAPEAVDTMTGALDWLKRVHPQLIAQTQLQAANLCADFGAEAARRFGASALEWPPASPAMGIRARLLEIRLGLAAGRRLPVEHTVDLLDQLDAMGLVRLAGATAVRMAVDHRRAGADLDAATLARWGLPRLPEEPRRTIAERRWVRLAHAEGDPIEGAIDLRHPVDPGEPVPTRGRRAGDRAPVSVRVLTPTLEVEVAGTPVDLRDMAAKLLLTLVISHPTPVHVERAADVLWPDGDPTSARRRLNTVVYRLRQELALDSRALRRSGDVLVLDPSGWDIDLVRWRHDVSGAGARRMAALRAVRGNLCHVQFPYDDLFLDERRVLAATAARAVEELAVELDERPEGIEQVLQLLDPDGTLVEP